MQITIDSANSLKTKKGQPYVSVGDTDGKHYSCFKEDIYHLLKESDTVEVEIETKGEYSNIVGAKNIKTGTAPQANTYADVKSNERTSIESQVAAKIVSELWQTGKLKDNDQEVEGLRRWLQSRLIPFANKPQSAEAVAVITKDTPDPEEPKSQKEYEPLKNLGDFLMRCMAIKKLTKTQVYAKLGKAVSEPLGDLDFAWATIDELCPDKDKMEKVEKDE